MLVHVVVVREPVLVHAASRFSILKLWNIFWQRARVHGVDPGLFVAVFLDELQSVFFLQFF